MRWTIAAFLILATQPPAAGQAPGQAEHASPHDPFADLERLGREAVVRAVLERNRDVEAMRQAWLAARERPAQAGSLADPTVSWGVAPLSIGARDVGFGQELRVEQPLPYPGRRALRRNAAEAEAAVAGADLSAIVLDLAAEAARLFDDYALVHRALAINADHRRLLEDVLRVATARYSAGLAPQQEPLQAETEGAELLVRESELDAERAVVTARLNALLHRGSELPLPPPAEDALARTAGELPDLVALEEAALAARPEVQAHFAALEARRAALELARLGRRPDFALMGSYSSMWMDTEHRWMAGVAIDLPVWRRRIRAAEREAEALVARHEAEREHFEHEVRGEVRQAHARAAAAARVVTLHESRLLPAARDQIGAARAAFETGEAPALAVLEAERGLRRAELGYAEALAALSRNLTTLDRAAGRLPVAGGVQ
jgi:outer membrane protein TolC